ncbi:MAG: DUF6468 domain-containing protein [Alphaproteobacteria bacterium]
MGLIVDVLGAVLMAAVIFYVIRLNANLKTLKAGKAELEALIAAFTESTNRAEASVLRLKSSATETATALQANVTKAQELRDDLSFMTDRADELATRLEGAIAAARGVSPATGATTASQSRTQQPPKADESQDERGKSKAELLRALQGMR